MPNPDPQHFAALRHRLTSFDAIIDARSPAEFAEDHLPGAVNHPVLNTEERAVVGTLYKQNSFEARKVGAVLVARNIASHIETSFASHPIRWKPLVYCWRGGNRSGAMAHILARVGWQVTLLEGGYKMFRRAVIDDLEQLPDQFSFQVICGPTGSGKSRLLRALARQGAQVLDLEELAHHRGSVLGGLPDQPQPGQRAFETAIWHRLSGFSATQAVFVEAESKQIGKLRVPEQLMLRMRGSPCIALELPMGERVRLLVDEYAHLIAHPDQLVERLETLVELHGHDTINRWKHSIELGNWPELVSDLLNAHYDPAYRRSTGNNYRHLADAQALTVDHAADADFDLAARSLQTQGSTSVASTAG